MNLFSMLATSVKSVFTIAGRELRSFFNTTIGWLVLAGFLLLTGIFWSSMVRFYVQQSTDVVANPYAASYMNFTDYLLAPFFGNTAVVLLLLCPALSMRLFSEEMKQGTLELLLTSPVSTFEIVLGKYLGDIGIVAAMMIGTFMVPLSLYIWGEPDMGAFIGGYAGLMLIASATIAMGMMFSAFTQNQLGALDLALSGALALWVISWVSQSPDNLFEQLAMISHVEDLIKGVVKVSDLGYFAAFIGFFVFATWQRVESYRWR